MTNAWSDPVTIRTPASRPTADWSDPVTIHTWSSGTRGDWSDPVVVHTPLAGAVWLGGDNAVIKVGADDVDAVWWGDQQVWPDTGTAVPPGPPPLVPELPFAMPTRATMAAADRDVLAYFHTLPTYWRNSNPTLYSSNVLPSSSPGIGGRWRQRPYPTIEQSNMTDADRVAYAKADITLAASIGIDVFSMNIVAGTIGAGSNDAWRWAEHIVPHYDAAAEFSTENDPGFACCPNISMLSVSGQTGDYALATTYADALVELLEHPAAYKRDGRPVVCLYNVASLPASWYRDFYNRLLNTHGINAALIPSHQSGNVTAISGADWLALFSDNIFVALHPWNGPSPTIQPANLYSIFRNFCDNNDIPFCGSAGPAWENDRPLGLKEREGQGGRGYRNSWESTVLNGDPLMQIVSWNDHEESHNIRPSTGYQWAPYDITAYYLAWYKTGTRPVITRDAVFYAHRMHRYAKASGAIEYDATYQTVGTFDVSFPPVLDKVYTLLFLTAVADVIVTINGVEHVHADVPAGVSYVEDDLVADATISFRVERNGTVVVPEFDSAFPTRSGIRWQDLLYRMGSSTRPAITGVQDDLPQDR